MKVLHVIPSIARVDGGPSEVIRGWLGESQHLSLSMQVLTTDKGVTASDDDLVSDPRVTMTKARWPLRYSFSPALLARAFTLIKTTDLVHIHSLHTFSSTVALWMAALLRRKVVLQPHGALDAYHWHQGEAKKTWYSRLIDGASLRRVERLVVSTSFEAEQRAPEWSRKISAAEVTLGVDPSLFTIAHQTAESTSERVVLFLGRVTQKKRLDLVLGATAALLEKGVAVKVLVAGPVDDQLQWDPKEMAHSLGIYGAVEFLGSVDQHQRRRLLSLADAFVLPSDDESFGVAVAEALASGCHCVVTSSVGIAKEAALAGVLEIAPASVDGIAESLATLLERQGGHLNLRGRAYAQDHFTWRKSLAQLAAMYESISSTRR